MSVYEERLATAKAHRAMQADLLVAAAGEKDALRKAALVAEAAEFGESAAEWEKLAREAVRGGGSPLFLDHCKEFKDPSTGVICRSRRHMKQEQGNMLGRLNETDVRTGRGKGDKVIVRGTFD